MSLRLLTRHKTVEADTLWSVGLLEDTFDEIIVVGDHQRKSEFVHCESIFIDNEFLERQDVRLRAGVPVLNSDKTVFL